MKKIVLAGLAALGLCFLIGALWVAKTLSHLPNVSVLKHYRPAAASEILDKDGHTLTEFYDRKYRVWVPVSSLPEIVIEAVVTAEDDTFFEHKGINYKATWDALVTDVEKRRYARGGSTITQQMIKNVFLSKEKTLSRKLREYVLARKAEEILTKRKILEIYLNEVEWGDNIYGIEAASRFYFDKHASELTAGEAALLAGMLPNPHYYNPFKRPEKARERQERVLSNMLLARLITRDVFDETMRAPLVLRRDNSGRFDFSALKNTNARPCYQYALEDVLLRLFGDQTLYRGGRTIRTTIDKALQDSLAEPEDPSRNAADNPPDRVVVVLENGLVRAILCSPDQEQAVRDRLQASGLGSPRYDAAVVSTEDIAKDQIVLPAGGP